MPRTSPNGHQRVVVVTGGGAGIGAAIAEELGHRGRFVVTMDPLVTLDGTEQLPVPEETTAGRIVAAGGWARASSVSVTDGEAVRDLFAGLVDEHGRLDAVINVAGITRPTTFAKGSEEDWLGVLQVHLDGYLNILGAALPIMAAAGHGHILGVTSGSGWRAADTGAYGCAKRAVASLTWQLGDRVPPGVVVNAMSPIAVTRMVTAALGRAPRAGTGGSSATGGLSLGSMPAPDELGPLGAHLVDDAFSWCRGQVIFAGGSEVAVIDRPRLIEVVRADEVTSLTPVLEAVTAGALVPAEAQQASGGGSNPRFGSIFDPPTDGEVTRSAAGACAVVSDRPELVAAITSALEARGVATHHVEVDGGVSFPRAAQALATVHDAGPLDAVILAMAAPPGAASGSTGSWEQVLAEHTGIVDHIHADAAWARAVADLAASADRPLRLVTLTDATTAGGRSRAQSSAQLARAAWKATSERVGALAISVETADERHLGSIGALAAHLVCSADALALSGAELVAGAGWFGLRSHPRPGGSITFGGPEVPDWLDDALRAIVGAAGAAADEDRAHDEPGRPPPAPRRSEEER